MQFGVFLLTVRNQEKGVLAKGVSARVEHHALKKCNAKYRKDIGPSSAFGNQSATAKRGVHLCKNPLLKTPLFLIPDTVRETHVLFLINCKRKIASIVSNKLQLLHVKASNCKQ